MDPSLKNPNPRRQNLRNPLAGGTLCENKASATGPSVASFLNF